MKVAVVTPYHRESLAMLRRCHDSVRRQTHACTHIMVADGHAKRQVDAWQAQHVVLPLAHGDYGNTPRALGAISALNQGFDAVAFLDADNWYADDHVASLIAACRETGCPVAFSSRWIVFPDGDVRPAERDEAQWMHADTSCFFITSAAAFLLPAWAMMDPAVSSLGDRVMLDIIRARRVPHAFTGHPTVYYETHWAIHYREAGKPVPPGAHDPDLGPVAATYSLEAQAARLGPLAARA